MSPAQIVALEVARMLRDWPSDGMLRMIGEERGAAESLLVDEARKLMGNLYRAAGVRACRTCGCTQDEGCDVPGSCSWVEDESKRVVYERMQLCVLAEAVKKAALGGQLSTSHAVLLARIPAQFQEAALKKMLEGRNGHGGPMAMEEAREFVLEEYTLGLADAPWDLKDATLVPAAGPCTTCPKRTGNQPELFSDVKAKDTCTDPGCFGAKKKAWVGLTLKKAADDGRPVTTAAEAKKAVKSGEYVDLDEKKYIGDRYQSYREALGKKKPEVVLAPAPEGVQELVREEDVEKLLGKKKKSAKAAKTAQVKKAKKAPGKKK